MAARRSDRPHQVGPREWWVGLSRTRQGATLGLLAVEVALTSIAIVDLVQRPARAVRGPKVLWVLACVVQPVGPIAYLTIGRRTPRVQHGRPRRVGRSGQAGREDRTGRE